MSQSSVNNQIDADITNKTAEQSITAVNVGSNMKAVNNRIEEAISENIQNNLMPSATKAVTANAVLAGLESVALPYKSYVALISQSGTSAPTVTVLQNDFTDTISRSRVNAGRYNFTFSGTQLTVNKTVVFVTPDISSFKTMMAGRIDPNIVRVEVVDIETNLYADGLSSATLEIRVYN